MTAIDTSTCRKCGGEMVNSKAIAQTYVGGSPDLPSDKHSTTFSAGGPGKVIECMKCSACGWSVSGEMKGADNDE